MSLKLSTVVSCLLSKADCNSTEFFCLCGATHHYACGMLYHVPYVGCTMMKRLSASDHVVQIHTHKKSIFVFYLNFFFPT